MNGFDIAFLLVLLMGAWKGWSNGLLKEVLGLIGVFVGLYVARLLYEQVGEHLAPHLGTAPAVANIIAFALLWMGVPILLSILGSLLTKFLELVGLDSVNRIGGTVVSLVKYALLLGVLCNVLSITHLVKEETQQTSFLFAPLKQTTSLAFDLAKSQWQKASQDKDSSANEL